MGDALLGGQAKPLHNLGMVLRDAQAIGVRKTQVVLGGSVALLGKRPPFAQRRRVVATFVGGDYSPTSGPALPGSERDNGTIV